MVTTIISSIFIWEEDLTLRIFVGLTFGYALARGYMGFAGSVSRAYNTGSTKLLRSMMFLFGITSTATTLAIYVNGADNLDLWVNSINSGLIIGAFMFGFGMVFASCCASGILVNTAGSVTRWIWTLFFFGLGVLVGVPIQSQSQMVQSSWYATSGFKGVYFPDLFG